MALPLVVVINPASVVSNELADKGGNWQYVGAEAFEETTGQPVKLIAMKRDNRTAAAAFPASILTATVLFASQDNEVSDHFTIQGLHDLTSGNETGSVSAASWAFKDYIGGTFTFAAGTLTVYPAGVAPAHAASPTKSTSTVSQGSRGSHPRPPA
jgi:hypothetical protein